MAGRRPFTNEEIKAILAELGRGGRFRLRNVCLFTLGIYTGFRISELLSIRLDDVLHRNGTKRHLLRIEKKRMKGKRKPREVPLMNTALGAIQDWLDDYRRLFGGLEMSGFYYLFPSNGHPLRPIYRRKAYTMLKAASAAAGVDPERIGTHSMRKTFAHRMKDAALDAGMDGVEAIRFVQDMLGHADLTSTTKYLAYDEDRKLELMEKGLRF